MLNYSHIWLVTAIVGVIVEFLIGFLKTEIEKTSDGKGETEMVVMAAAFATSVMVVSTFTKYCVTIPHAFILKLFIFALMLAGIMVVTAVLFAISLIGERIAEDVPVHEHKNHSK